MEKNQDNIRMIQLQRVRHFGYVRDNIGLGQLVQLHVTEYFNSGMKMWKCINTVPTTHGRRYDMTRNWFRFLTDIMRTGCVVPAHIPQILPEQLETRTKSHMGLEASEWEFESGRPIREEVVRTYLIRR